MPGSLGGAWQQVSQNRVDQIRPLASAWQFVEMIVGVGANRATRRAQQEDAELRSYMQQAAGNSHLTTADQLEKLASLRDRGVISPAEFDQAKARVLGQGPADGRASS